VAIRIEKVEKVHVAYRLVVLQLSGRREFTQVISLSLLGRVDARLNARKKKSILFALLFVQEQGNNFAICMVSKVAFW
jgi:hypothetical protein